MDYSSTVVVEDAFLLAFSIKSKWSNPYKKTT